MTETKRMPCLSDGAIAALREDLAESKEGEPMSLSWLYVSKALDEIEWLRERETVLERLTKAMRDRHDLDTSTGAEIQRRCNIAEARAAELEARLAKVKAKAAEMVIAATEVAKEEMMRLRTELAIVRAQLTTFATEPFGLSPEQALAIKKFVVEQNAEMAKDCLVVGQFYRHPHSDRLLQVTDGSYLGGYGRVSNWWHWSYLDEDFSPVGELDQGYGWAAKPVERPQVCDHCGVPANEESDRDEQCSVCGKGNDR